MNSLRRFGALGGVILFGAAAACGSEKVLPPPPDAGVTLAPDRDNTLYENPAGALSNGAGQSLFAGLTNDTFVRRAILHFDLASSAIPAASTIDSVRLTLNMRRTIAGSRTVALHRVTADWGEAGSNAGGAEGMGAPAQPGDATWIHQFYDTDLWAAPGGDFAAAASASVPVGNVGPYTWGSTAQLVADVQGWLDNPASNLGWILIGDESAKATAKQFDSRESSVGIRPELRVFFTKP